MGGAHPQISPITADAGYFSDANIKALHDQGIPALIADNGMRQRDERFVNQARRKQAEVLCDKRGAAKPIKFLKPGDFVFHEDKTVSCPAGRTLTGTGTTYGQRGHCLQRYQAMRAH